MRKRNEIILAIIGYIVFFFCMEGWGADWKKISMDVEGNVWSIDTASISRQPDSITRVWVKVTHSKTSVTDWVKNVGEKYKDLSYSMFLEEVHCTGKTNRLLSMAHYSLDGGVIHSTNFPGVEWNLIVPDSTGDFIFNKVCK